jgi:hypothetical protein
MRGIGADLIRTLTEERKMAFLAGPRQVGKTTLARSLIPEARAYFNWDIDADRRRLVRSTDGFWQDRVGPGRPARIVLDEIHRFPRWKRFLKGLHDGQGRDLEVLVTGSGRLDLYQRGGDSLLGRYDLHHLHPFTVGELLAEGRDSVLPPKDFLRALDEAQDARGAEEAVDRVERFGGFPDPLFKGRDETLVRWRRARRNLVLREDLRDLTRIRELGLLESLVLLLPERIGAPLSINALREDLGVSFTTVQDWIEALRRLFYLFELRPYAGKLARTLRREGKLYFFDAGEAGSEGARFENLVALHLLKLRDTWNDRGLGEFELHYVRDKEKREVDFLLTERRKPFLLAEAKLADASPSPALRYFSERLRPARTLQVLRRGAPSRHDDVLVLPASRFLRLM